MVVNKIIIIKNNTKKGTQRYTLTCHDKRNTGMTFSQPMLQRYLSVFSTE